MKTAKDLRASFKNTHSSPSSVPRTEETETEQETPKQEEKDKKPTKEQEWLKQAKEISLTRDKAELIIRTMFTGPDYQYTEKFQLPRNTLLILGTRKTSDAERLEDDIHMQHPRAPEVLAGLVFRHNAAASLIRFGDKEFKHETEEDFRDTLEWLRSLPEPLTQVISKYLSRFDAQVSLAMHWIGIENF
jgi:hypothetical protein